MKTKVLITSDVYQEQIKKGDMGYIDGYATMADNRHYAIVVIPQKYIGYVPLNQLKPIIDYSDER